jgi:chemotaxis protein CheX
MDTSLAEPGLNDTDLAEIIAEVWDAYLQRPSANPTDAPPPDGLLYTAAVSITGAWDGHVRVISPPGPASEITALMLAVDDADVTEQDITDAMGELVNVIGGNLKNRGAQPAKLGLPVVSTGKVLFPSTKETHRLAVEWQGEPVVLSVLRASRPHESTRN